MLALISFLTLGAEAQFLCDHLFPDGTLANLTALFRAPGELGYQAKDDEGNTYVMNVCGVDPNCQQNSMMCKFNSAGTYDQSVARWGVGRAPEWSTIERGQGVMLKFTNGDSCTDAKGTTVESVALLAFTCSPNKVDAFSVRKANCVYMVTFPTVHACNSRPAVGPLSSNPAAAPGPVPPTVAKKTTWGLTTLLLVGLMIYCCVGCIWRFKMGNACGVDLIPHLAFWTALATFVKDLCEQLVEIVRHRIEKCRDGGKSSVRGQYEEVETIPFDDTDNNL